MLAWFGAAASLWVGARGMRDSGSVRGYRWLAGAALLWCVGLIAQQVDGVAVSLSFADLPSLLAVAAGGIGIAVLALPASRTTVREPDAERAPVLPGLADGYVMAVSLLVLGWVTLFSAEFHRSGARPGSFLLDLIHPLADLAVLGALLPVVSAARRRATVPYLSLVAVAVADALAVGQRVTGGHAALAAQLVTVLGAVMLGAAPWSQDAPGRITAGAGRLLPSGRAWVPGMASAGAATVIAALTACVATVAVVLNGLATAPSTGLALVVAGGAGVLVLAARIFMLVRENGVLLGIWRDSSGNLRELANRTSDVVLVCDLAGQIQYASLAVSGYGYRPDNLTGRRLSDLVHPEDRRAAIAAVRLELGAGSADGAPVPGRFPCRVRAADGTWRHIEATALRYSVPGSDGQMLITVRDVSDQVALRQQVAHLTFHDGLTGLPNRAYLEERARDTMAAGAGVIFLDLDRFTAVNDSVGHGAGDLVLAQAARRLRAVVPTRDTLASEASSRLVGAASPGVTIARWGSDEFSVLVEPSLDLDESGIAELAARLARAISTEPFRVAGQQVGLTASVGVALAQPDAMEPAVVLRNADVAMSRAKEAGGDRVEVYAAHMHADVVRRLELVSDLQRAIADGEMTLLYQPVVELATSRVTGAEALVRWREGVPPREFLRVAEESGLIVPLGEWVLHEACAQGAAWRAAGWDIGISVNLSARQITAPGFVDSVAATLAETGLPATALTMEVNERVLVTDAGLIVERLAELRTLGIALAIDDFGTGYASLVYLRQLPVDIIKIDPSFVDGLGRDETLTLLTRTVVQLGRDLRLKVIAEGIEQPRQLDALRDMGCGYGQGFLVARPMAAPRVEALIRTDSSDPVSGYETTSAIS
ncbi:MAG TPA: GGDEF domain-containing protein [Streptosporangiaceae bacterium]|nr:GGDEF domain-containing protein [Streptosporangiaceae bacterium]